MKLKGRAGKFQRLRSALDGLRSIASRSVAATAVLRFGQYVRGRVKGELARHVDTGRALGTATIGIQTKSIDVTLQSYYRYIPWSWKKGVPISVLNRGRKIVVEAYETALRMGGT